MNKIKQNNWRNTTIRKDNIIPCNCPRWETCKYGAIIDWTNNNVKKRYAVCGYSFITDDVRGCSISECNKYISKAS